MKAPGLDSIDQIGELILWTPISRNMKTLQTLDNLVKCNVATFKKE